MIDSSLVISTMLEGDEELDEDEQHPYIEIETRLSSF